MNSYRVFELGSLFGLLAPILVLAAPPPPVTALAYRPDGKQLAVGLRGEVRLLDGTSGTLVTKIPGQSSQVTALAWSRDGAWLAAASGLAAKTGEIRIYKSGSTSPEKTIAAHADRIHDLAFSPGGKTLASCSYDRLIKLWDVATGNELRTLKDHSDAVYGLAFRPDGKLLASVAADRAVKVWNVETGVRLYTLADATDWVYAVAWSPDGKHLAAAGVDKSIRIWKADDKEGKLVATAFAHEKPVLRLAYSGDGAALFSLGEDRRVKSWDATKLAEKKVYPVQAESVLAFALRGDGKQLAVGRYDGVLVLVDAATGKTTGQPLPEKPTPPKATRVTPNAAPLGATVTLTFEGENLSDASGLNSAPAGIEVKSVLERDANKARFLVQFPANIDPAAFQLKVKSPAGESNPVTFFVDRFAAQAERVGTESPRSAPEISPQSTISGGLSRAGEVDYFRIHLKAGAEIGVQAQLMPGSKLEPVLALEDSAGNRLSETTSGALGHRAASDGTYLLSVRDRDYRGGGEFKYRLHVGAIPVVTSFSPLGLQRGQKIWATVRGVNLGGELKWPMAAPAGAAIGSRLPLLVTGKFGHALNTPSLVVGEFPEFEFGQPIQIPGTANGALATPREAQTWRFAARKNQPLIVEIGARRLGSPLDSVIEILDAKGEPVQHAVLRAIAKTTVAFRDHDATGPGIRMVTWNEFAMDDYVLIGHELMRIRDLPRNPDDDCQFYAVNGQRVGYLGTTPTFHAQDSPMFKVAIHPPGTTFPPNGMPVAPIWYRNDDGGPGFSKDSRLRFDPPADGEYQVRVSDARGFGGPDFAYRLTIRPPRPDFAAHFNPTAPSVGKGSSIPVTVTVDRVDEFDDRIQVRMENLPPGFSAPPTFIEAGQMSTTFALFADSNAPNEAAKTPSLKLVASARIGGKEVIHEAAGGAPKRIDPGDIVATAAQSIVSIKPGQETRLLVHVERRNGFKGRIPLDVLGLPHGVRVLNVGLNGILVTERDTAREVFIYAEPWVKPMEHPFVVLARREGKNSEHGAKSVLLKVE